MNRDNSKKLRQMLDAIAAKKASADANAHMRQQSADNFVRQFVEQRDSVIRPAMEGFLATLRESGHEGQIDASPLANNEKSESIQLRYFMHGERPDHNNAHSCPSIRFTAEAHNQTVSIAISRMTVRGGGSAGPAGTLSLGALTRDKVDELMVSVLEGLQSLGT